MSLFPLLSLSLSFLTIHIRLTFERRKLKVPNAITMEFVSHKKGKNARTKSWDKRCRGLMGDPRKPKEMDYLAPPKLSLIKRSKSHSDIPKQKLSVQSKPLTVRSLSNNSMASISSGSDNSEFESESSAVMTLEEIELIKQASLRGDDPFLSSTSTSTSSGDDGDGDGDGVGGALGREGGYGDV